ncbi:MAG TPA: phage N-6-adenine-methyltransferase [Rheinheimera sp.]|uniref:phage N-6-adenine-methyltransferase n=1 Tax=Rheinheimera sp. TaxID=1869214 RepID=UPI000ED038AD|nr:phage N-6-adenine-methyltransferase [Rheinheimera sp.]HCU64586.1 phage N-6-adenine-methyltransferase [Rheinheimera sp.]
MNRDAYRTPPELFAALDAEFNFKLDVAASESNALCVNFIDEQLNALACDWLPDPDSGINQWHFVWCNPPYSDIGPWVRKAAEQSKQGIGCAMLVMADTSVGWYAEAIKTCQEVRFIVGGRISFIDPQSGKPAAGNNKGSMFLIWHPFGRTAPLVSHMQRDELMAKGREVLAQQQTAEPEKPAEPVIQASPEIAHKWPLEVTESVESALDQCPCEPSDVFYAELCAQANALRLSGKTNGEAIQVLVATLKKATADYLQGEAA